MSMLRAILLILTVMLSFDNIRAQHQLNVQVELNRPDAGGMLRVALCPSKASFDAEKGCTVRDVPATGGTVNLTFAGLAEGDHAVKVFHDVNGNGVLDTNWMGIPKEPYGFGNDAMGTFGPPTWEQAKVAVRGPTLTRVRMRG